jgi:hypothetical protein
VYRPLTRKVHFCCLLVKTYHKRRKLSVSLTWCIRIRIEFGFYRIFSNSWICISWLDLSFSAMWVYNSQNSLSIQNFVYNIRLYSLTVRHQQPRKRIDLIRQVQVVTRTLQKWKHWKLYRERTSERVLLLLKNNVITSEAVVCATTTTRAENLKSFDRLDYYWNIVQHAAPVLWPNTVVLYLWVINCSADSLVMIMSIRGSW